jgi:phenylacetate-CoA ligase
VILLGSENIYEWQKEKLRAAFPTARLFGWYGHTEQAVLACWCEYSEHYHDWPFYGLTEVLGKDDEPVKLDQAGEIVGTSFLTQGTPFIRYRTMDHVEYGEVGCEACNRQFVMMHRIIGRVQNALISTSGRQIPVPSTSIHDNSFEKVHQFQFYQDTPGKVVFRLVRKDSYDERDTLKIRQVLMSKLGEDMELSIEFIQEIPRTARGKYQFLDQRLDVK